jgi:hypothetical protein
VIQPGAASGSSRHTAAAAAASKSDTGSSGNGKRGITLEHECLAVTPVKGGAAVFFPMARAGKGEAEARAWHAGAAVGVGKWALQVFEQLPATVQTDEQVRNFLLNHRVPVLQHLS